MLKIEFEKKYIETFGALQTSEESRKDEQVSNPKKQEFKKRIVNIEETFRPIKQSQNSEE